MGAARSATAGKALMHQTDVQRCPALRSGRQHPDPQPPFAAGTWATGCFCSWRCCSMTTHV